jgi:hypothetical protein
MHGQPSIKICTAKQAKQMFRYKRIKIKLYKNNAAIWYNKTHRIKQLTPNYINIRVNGNNTKSQKNKKFVYQVGNNKKVILWCTANQISRCNSFISFLLDVYVSLSMFRASPRPSSGAYNCINCLWFYRCSMVVAALLVVVARPQPTMLLSPRSNGKTRGS